MNNTEEARRIVNGPAAEEEPQGAEILHLRVECDGDAGEVLQRSQEVLLAILDNPAREIASLRAAVPEWFRDSCAPEETPEQARARIERRRSLPLEQQLREEREERWSVDAWLHWFTDEERFWSWWSAHVVSPNTLDISVAVTDWPAPLDALGWTFRAAGANHVEADD